MAEDTDDLFTPITEMVQQIVDLGVIYQIGFCLGIIVLSLLIVKLVFTRIAWNIVKKTKNDWDNAAPVSYTHLTLPTNREV